MRIIKSSINKRTSATSFPYKGYRIKLLNDGTGWAIYENQELVDYGFRTSEDAKSYIDSNNIDSNNEHSSINAADDLSMYSDEFRHAYTVAKKDFKKDYKRAHADVQIYPSDPYLGVEEGEIVLQITGFNPYGKKCSGTVSVDESLDSNILYQAMKETAEDLGIRKGSYDIKNSTSGNMSIKATRNKNSSVRLQMKEELMDQILSEIKSKLKEVMASKGFGFFEDEVDDYSGADIYLDNRGYIVITVYAEVSYPGLVKIMDALNPIVEKYDSDAYFDADTPGRCSAYIDPDNVPSNMYPYDDIQNSEKVYSSQSQYTPGIYSAIEEGYDEEELQDIIDELTADGFDVTDEADLLMGLGADLGMDRADARYYAKLILNHIDDSSVLGAEEDEDSLPMVDQEYDSAATSINSNKLPAIYKMVNFNEGDVIVDFGGGKFDNAVEYIRDKGATLCVYDPYNRSAEHNKEVLRILRENGGADAAVNSNVLNVIKEPEARKNVLENIARITKSGAPIYITVYEGRGDGQEGPTKSGYQLNRKTADYLEEVQEVFPDAIRKGKLIIAHNSRVSAATNTANIGAKITCSDVDSDAWVKLAQKKVLDSDGSYTDYTMYSNEDGTSYIFMFGDEDIYEPDPQYADYECSNWDEAAEWWNDYNGFGEDDIFEEAIECASNEVELDPEESMIDMNIDQYIIVDSEGSWDYDSDNYDWASSDGQGSDWYSDNGVRLDDSTGVVEKIDELIEPHVPIEPGTYRVQGYIELHYTVSGVYENRYDYTEDDYSSDINSDFGSAEYNKKLSKIENVKVTKI